MALVIKNSRGQSYRGVAKIDDSIFPILFNSPDSKEVFHYSKEDFRNLREGLYNVSTECYEYSLRNEHSIFMGGDHLTSFGTVLASLRRFKNEFRLIWIDAHTDIHGFETSPSWNLHGMVVRLLMTHSYEDIPRLKPEQILYVGSRSVEKEEMDFIQKNQIEMISMDDWQNSLNNSLKRIQDFIIGGNVHISLDVDAIDPTELNSTGTPVENGLSSHDILDIIDVVRMYSNHFATDIMEFNPELGDFKLSINTLKKIVARLVSM
jgi:arginase